MRPRVAHSPRSASAGFTLIEVLVGLVLLALAALLALPMTRTAVAAQAMRSAASDFASLARMTRSAAAMAGVERTLAFDSVTRTYWSDGIAPPRPLPAGVSGELKVAGVARARVQVIRFMPGGGSTGGRLVLDNGSRTAVVTVDWLTGGTDVAW